MATADGMNWGSIGTNVVQGAATGALGQAMGMIFHGVESKQQQSDAKALQEIQLAGMDKAGAINERWQKQLWDDTNKEAEVKHLDAAGLNPALAEVTGTGGGVTGVGAPMPEGQKSSDVAARESVGAAMGMNMAQQQLITAQARLANVQADKLAGVDTSEGNQRIDESKSRQKLNEFQQQVNESVGVNMDAAARKANDERATRDNDKAAIEYDAWLNAALDNKQLERDDPNSPLTKMYKANISQVFQNLKNSEKDGDIKAANATIEQFKADLAKNGIPPDSPWYAKLLGDLLDKLGWNPMKAVVKTVTHSN